MALLGYARFYQQVFELLPHEQPEDKVIEDDTALDAWWQTFWAEKRRELAKAMGKKAANSAPVTFNNLPMFQEK